MFSTWLVPVEHKSSHRSRALEIAYRVRMLDCVDLAQTMKRQQNIFYSLYDPSI
jgi:hypothetical protein